MLQNFHGSANVLAQASIFGFLMLRDVTPCRMFVTCDSYRDRSLIVYRNGPTTRPLRQISEAPRAVYAPSGMAREGD